MTNRIVDVSLSKAAIIAGYGLLLMTIFAVFATSFVTERLIVPGDAATTVINIDNNKLLFRAGICSLLIVAILDVVVAWALYILLKPVNKSLSLLAAWLRVVYAAIFAIALNNLLNILYLLNNADYLKVFETNQLHVQVMFFLNAFSYGWDIGLAIFGLHLLILGYLVFESGYIPRILGGLVIIASFGYVIDSFGKFLSANYNITVSMFTFIGELLLMVWLLWKGPKIPVIKE